MKYKRDSQQHWWRIP